MKKLLFLISPLVLFFGCEKEYDGIIQPVFYPYQVTSISPLENFTFTRQDSVRTINIVFDNADNIRNVNYTLLSPSGSEVKVSPFSKITDNLFSAPLLMSVNYPPGRYTLKYYVTDISDKTREIAVHFFNYENVYYINAAPIIRNVIIDPDTVTADTTVFISVKAEVYDENTLRDIALVYFIVYRPNGTTSGNQIQLNDDGIINDNNWDEVAGDGIYSRIIQVNETNDKGAYRFEFRARDKGNKFSEIISYSVLIQ